MLPLPRLHHYDIMTIVELFYIYVLSVTIRRVHRASTKLFCHILTQKKGKNSIPCP